EAERDEHLVTGRHPAVDAAAEGGPEAAPLDAGVGERRADRVRAERGEALLREAAEGMEADAGHVDRPHATSGRKAYERTAVPSSSVQSGSTTRRSASPGRRRSRRDSVSRVMTRSPPSSSTTPKPYGTSPR